MDLLERRALITTQANPDSGRDYVITQCGDLNGGSVRMRYVPDKLIVTAEAFQNYLLALSGVTWESPEELSVTIISDVSNEVVGRWIQVVYTDEKNGHSILLEDQQPAWSGDGLISRLSLI